MKEKRGNEKKESGFVKWFSELSNKDVAIAGGKGASLAEMYNNKFPIPGGFVINADAYRYFIDKTDLNEKISKILEKIDIEDTESLQHASKKIRELINSTALPDKLKEEILEAYEILDVDKQSVEKAGGGVLGILKTGYEPPFVAVRSSATTEDLADASFAGQQETFLNIKGDKELLRSVKDCFSSLFTARAIYYREKKGFEHDKSYLAVVVQKMVDSEKSGVVFSQNPMKKDKSIVIEAVFGLGEGIVSGMIKPDHYVVSADLENFNILDSRIAEKKIAIVRNSGGNNTVVKLTQEKGGQQVLTSYEIKRLSQYAKQLEEHYGKPQDIEFAIEGKEIYIVQSRPITTKFEEREQVELSGKILLSGLGASPGIASGVVKIIGDMNDLKKIKKGDVLVTKMTNPDMVVAMQKSAAIVTDEGGLTSHASIVSREMGIPAVVGTETATEKLHDGEIITVDGSSGKVFEGKAETKLVEIEPIVQTKTKIKVIVDLPDFASRAAKSGASAVGLTRLEGIIASSGKHPLAYVKEEKIEEYVAVLVKGLKKILEPFEEVWVRSSDIRSDEYGNLKGAPQIVEGNPMLGDHGIRFSLKHLDIMRAELKAVKEIAESAPQKKIGLMAPQIISVDEIKKMKVIASEIGMPANVKIGIMVETPAAVQIIDSLCEEGINFISFGTNDLTQFTLAIDRNNTEVQNLYDEMHPAVLSSLAYVIARCKEYGVETSICGQAGSRLEMAKFLVMQGIDSISVNADAARKVSEIVAEIEKELAVKNSAVGKEREQVKVEEEKAEVLEPEIEVPRAEGRTESGEFVLPQMQAVERAEMQAISEFARGMPKPQINQVEEKGFSNKNEGSEDIESIILKELGENNDYQPGNIDNKKKKDIPPLNEAIPIESEHFVESLKGGEDDGREKEINLDVRKKEGEEGGEEKKKESEKSDLSKAKGKEKFDLTGELGKDDDELGEEWNGERS